MQSPVAVTAGVPPSDKGRLSRCLLCSLGGPSKRRSARMAENGVKTPRRSLPKAAATRAERLAVIGQRVSRLAPGVVVGLPDAAFDVVEIAGPDQRVATGRGRESAPACRIAPIANCRSRHWFSWRRMPRLT